MQFNLVTLFPEYFPGALETGLMGKARAGGLVRFTFTNPREFTTDVHRTVDDRPFGGGPGMVMMVDPLKKALESLEKPGRVLVMDPSGAPFDQSMARELAGEESLTLVCGRYEGIDARFEELTGATPVSVGDFVINGGEAAALCVIEATARLLPGFMGHKGSGDEESHAGGLLEYPHYTRPEEYEGVRVPSVLTSGDHGRIASWRREQSLAMTLQRRPELLATARLDKADLAELRSMNRRRRGRNLSIALVHHPVLDKRKKIATTSLTNLDIHDISRCSRSYGIDRFYVVTPLGDQQELLEGLLEHWVAGDGAAANPDRAEALRLVRIASDLDEAVRRQTDRAGRPPRLLATKAGGHGRVTFAEAGAWLDREAVMVVLGTGHGLAKPILDACDGTLRPLRYMDDYNHLSVRSAASIILDRLLSDTF